MLAIQVTLAGMPLAQPQDNEGVPDAEVPYGVAKTWLFGRHLLANGEVEEALRNLHAVYRTHPEVPQVAWDFQSALVSGGYFKDAVKILDDLVADYPDSAVFRLQRSEVLLQVGENKRALKDLRTLRDQGHQTLDVILGEASVLAGMGKVDQALDTCREGLSLVPEDGPRIYLTMSVIMDQENRRDQLPALLNEAVAAYPDSPQLHDIRLRSLVALGRDEEAMTAAMESDRHFAQIPGDAGPAVDMGMEALEVSPAPMEPTSFVLELADTYTQLGRPEKAVGILEDMKQAGELGREPSLWLARLYLGTGRQDEGRALVDTILDRWPSAGQAWFLKGRALEGDGKRDEALDYFRQGVQYAPDDPQVRMGLVRGMLLAWEGRLGGANPSSEQQERMDMLKAEAGTAREMVAPGDAENQLILGYAFRAIGEHGNAVDAFRQAAVMPELHRAASLQLSVCFDDMGETGESLKVLEDLRRRYPGDPEVANSLGYFLAEKNTDLSRAERLIAEALHAEPGTGAYLDSMGWVKYRQARYDEAFDYMIQAVNVLPEDPIILEHLGLVLREMGQMAEAEEMLRRALELGGDPVRLRGHLDALTDPEQEP